MLLRIRINFWLTKSIIRSIDGMILEDYATFFL